MGSMGVQWGTKEGGIWGCWSWVGTLQMVGNNGVNGDFGVSGDNGNNGVNEGFGVSGDDGDIGYNGVNGDFGVSGGRWQSVGVNGDTGVNGDIKGHAH